MTEKSKTRSPQETKHMIATVRKTKTQDIKVLELKKQELELIKQLRSFEHNNNSVDETGKPSYANMQEYHDLVGQYKDVQLKYKDMELNDAISQLEERIKGTDKIIAEMSRGIDNSIVEEAIAEAKQDE